MQKDCVELHFRVRASPRLEKVVMLRGACGGEQGEALVAGALELSPQGLGTVAFAVLSYPDAVVDDATVLEL